MNNYVFKVNDYDCESGISNALKVLYRTYSPVIICVGSDLVVGDTLGPFIGTLLQSALKGKAFIYGTLDSPITAKEISAIKKTVKTLHPNSKILVIDAAVGKSEDIGLIKVISGGIKPGLGVNKNLDEIGDVSIIGIVSKRELTSNALLNDTRFSTVYGMAKAITGGISKYI